MTESSAGAPRRGYTRSMSGMIGAMIAVLGLVALLWGLLWLQHGKVADPARTVDYQGALQAARQQAPFHVLAPTPQPAGLRATSVGFDVAGPVVSWHLGFVTADKDYVGLYEGNASPPEFISASTPADQPGQPITVSGRSWRTLTNADQETALVRTQAGVTTVVTGTVPESELAAFVATLR